MRLRYLSGAEERSLIEMARSGCSESRNRLIHSQELLVRRCVSRFACAEATVADLFQEGMAALCQVVDKFFQADRGCRLSTYVSWVVAERARKYVNVAQGRHATVSDRESKRRLAKNGHRLRFGPGSLAPMDGFEEEVCSDVMDSSSDSKDEVDSADECGMVWGEVFLAMEGWTDQERQIVTMHLQGVDTREIASAVQLNRDRLVVKRRKLLDRLRSEPHMKSLAKRYGLNGHAEKLPDEKGPG